ncbi:MAG: tetratricopeptide repeat-containing sulfotransferase family protein [Steroidobacteraceae bacterium]
MQAVISSNPPSRIEAEVRRIRELLEKSQFAAALAAALTLGDEVPENRDVLYMTAVAQRYLGRLTDALATLERLEQTHPDYPRLYQERGHCHVTMRNAGPAIVAFERAVQLSPALASSWRPLVTLYKISERDADSDAAAAQLENLAKLPPEIVTAFCMYADHEVYDAERLLRQYLLTHGNHVEGMRLLAQIGMKMDVADDAEILLENVLALAPTYDAARYDYAMVLLRRHKHVRAREETQKLLAKDPANRLYRALLGTVHSGLGEHDRALQLYSEVLAETPNDPELHLSIGHALKTIGRAAEAVDAYRAAAAARPRYGEAYWSLANLKTYRFTDGEVARMRRDEAFRAVGLEDRYHLCFALGKALEDRGEYQESFAFYERGNDLKKSESSYRPEPLERTARAQTSVCTAGFFESRKGYGSDSPAPIFIVGLPRSGSTLLEQILASHSQVEGTMELADIPRLVQQLQGREMKDVPSRYPAALADLTAEDCRRLGERYLADTRVYRTGMPFFIDKMPNNFRHLGLIHLILPNAKIIDARRDPLACCFSNYKQLFASGQQFTYSVDDITRYHRMYMELMAHWNRVLPGRILTVEHESVVEDLESQVRRILQFCELPFEAACVDFYKTERRVHTASSEQVRRPINREGIDQWRYFEPWLGEFKASLAVPLEN